MNWYSEEDKLLRRYLLDDVTAEERRLVEDRLLSDGESDTSVDEDEPDFVDRLLLAEDELIDDYAQGILSERQKALFERNFQFSGDRWQKLSIAREFVSQADAENVIEPSPLAEPVVRRKKNGHADSVNEGYQPGIFSVRFGWKGLFSPAWKIAVYAALVLGISVLGISFGVWQWRGASAAAEAIAALNQAYSAERPIEARVTGFGYAPFRFSAQRGGEAKVPSQVDYVALERAKTILFGRSVVSTDSSVLQAVGSYFVTQGEFDKAIDQFKQALAQSPADARLQSDLGAAYLGKIERDRATDAGRSDEDVNECFRHLNRALELDPGLLAALFNRALLRQGERLRREAQADWEAYLGKDSGSPWANEARSHLNVLKEELKKVALQKEQLYQSCLAALQAGDKDQAVQLFNLSYSFNGNYIGEKVISGFLNARLGGRMPEAKEWLQRLTTLGVLVREETGDRFFADLARYYNELQPKQLALVVNARRLMGEANGFYQDAKNDRAVALYEQARQAFEQAGDTGEALFATAWIGHCHHQRSDTEHNLEVFTRLVPVCAERHYRWMQANALCGLANGHNAAGLFSRALEDCRQCGEISEKLGDQTGGLRSRYMLGAFYYALGKHPENLRLSMRGMIRADEIAADIRYAITFYNLSAWSLSALGYHEIALAYQAEAVRMAEESQHPRLLAHAYIYQGLLLAKDKRFDQAIASAQRGVTIGQSLKDDETGQDFVHQALLHLGHIYREAGKLTDSLRSFDQVLAFFRRNRNHEYFYGAAKSRLLTLMALGDDARVRSELEQVVALYEQYRQSIQEESNRDSFYDQEQGIYDIAIDFAANRLNEMRQALTYAELSRARSLLDLTQGGWQMVAVSETPDLLINAELPPPVKADEIQRQMPEQAQLLVYAVLEDKLVLWHITNAGVSGRLIALPQAELAERIRRYLALISQPVGTTADNHWREESAGLYDILIRPVESLLDRNKQLFIIPDKHLARVPFATLCARQSNRLLIEDYLLGYAASANMFLRATEQARQKAGVSGERLLAIGNPSFDRSRFPKLENLRSAETEATEIAACYNAATILLKGQATKTALMDGLGRVDVAHFALHYIPDPWSPMLSRMPLAAVSGTEKGDVMQLYELYQAKVLRPRLVVLAACQTRGEEIYAGEGAIGITRPFEAAGIPLIVATLWPVDNTATSVLMTAFHRARTAPNGTTTAALRATQLELLHSAGNYRHPYYWAPFIALGGYARF